MLWSISSKYSNFKSLILRPWRNKPKVLKHSCMKPTGSTELSTNVLRFPFFIFQPAVLATLAYVWCKPIQSNLIIMDVRKVLKKWVLSALGLVNLLHWNNERKLVLTVGSVQSRGLLQTRFNIIMLGCIYRLYTKSLSLMPLEWKRAECDHLQLVKFGIVM